VSSLLTHAQKPGFSGIPAQQKACICLSVYGTVFDSHPNGWICGTQARERACPEPAGPWQLTSDGSQERTEQTQRVTDTPEPNPPTPGEPGRPAPEDAPPTPPDEPAPVPVQDPPAEPVTPPYVVA